MKREIRIGTRGSQLALVQSRWVASELNKLGWATSLRIIRTVGDNITDIPLGQIDGKGLFVSEIEQALLAKEVDLAVHSMKDLPPEASDGLTVAAIPRREDPRDVLVGRVSLGLTALPPGAVVGSSSPRRRAQLLAARPDIVVADLRGNVDTRLRKLDEGQYDAICIAAAGLHRLGLSERITEYLDPEVIMPAACQGALALQTRIDDEELILALSPLHDGNTELVVRAETAVLLNLGWGCSVPLGLLATIEDGRLRLRAALCSLDGSSVLRKELASADAPEDLGKRIAELLHAEGAHLLD
ncbi:MAG: hydroxymethylbilane synthase [Armatimonadota bacterium]